MKLLDTFCGAGGAGSGYARAGFDVTGVDLAPQPRYPFEFHQADAIEFVREHGHEYDVIHCSPPCQRYSRGSKQSHTGYLHPDLIAATRTALLATGRPYVIENVADARPWLRSPFLLCGVMFPPLFTYRHRLFECSEWIWAPQHLDHQVPCPRSNVYVPGQFMTVYGHVSPVEKAREALGIDWPMTQREVTEAIPPAFTHWIGSRLMEALSLQEATA